MDRTFDLLTFSMLPVSGTRAFHAVRSLGSLGDLLSHPDELRGLLPERALMCLRSGAAIRAAAGEQRRAQDLGIRILGLDEPDYPLALRAIYDPPPVLYVRGEIPRSASGVAIVGARAASPRGIELGRAMGRELASALVTIVSGLARGIDTAAHKGALESDGSTVAVQGRGMDGVYPPENAGLAREIEKRGALISELPLGSAPLPESFPRRNRMIAGLSSAVVVVEARAKSGSLITARIALDEGREVLAVPGHPKDPLAEGTNQLIRDGAALVRNARDVAEEIGLVLPAPKPSLETDPVLAAFPEDDPVSLEELQIRSGRPLGDLLARLTELELSARVRRLPGPLFVRAGTCA